jgi:hypothetical protein
MNYKGTQQAADAAILHGRAITMNSSFALPE